MRKRSGKSEKTDTPYTGYSPGSAGTPDPLFGEEPAYGNPPTQMDPLNGFQTADSYHQNSAQGYQRPRGRMRRRYFSNLPDFLPVMLKGAAVLLAACLVIMVIAGIIAEGGSILSGISAGINNLAGALFSSALLALLFGIIIMAAAGVRFQGKGGLFLFLFLYVFLLIGSVIPPLMPVVRGVLTILIMGALFRRLLK